MENPKLNLTYFRVSLKKYVEPSSTKVTSGLPGFTNEAVTDMELPFVEGRGRYSATREGKVDVLLKNNKDVSRVLYRQC